MTLEIIVVIIILFVAVVLYATETLSIDLVSLMILISLMLIGILTPEEGVKGFSNPATVTVAAMFILSAGLSKTGALNTLANNLALVFAKNFWLGILVTMFTVGSVSAFINNTPVVAIFIPIMLRVSVLNKVSASKLLIPISYASMFGGVCTLIGTSTNILVSEISAQHGLLPFSMFEMTPVGLIFFGVGLLYMVAGGIRLLPTRKEVKELSEKFGLGDYITEVVLQKDSPVVGQPLGSSYIIKDLGCDIIEVVRGKNLYFMPSMNLIMEEKDILRVKCDIEKIKMMQERPGLYVKSGYKFTEAELKKESLKLVEVIIAPNSELEGKTLKEINFRKRFRGFALAIRHRGELMRERVGNTPLYAGDALLLEVREEDLKYLREREMRGVSPFMIVSKVPLPEYRFEKTIPALLIIAGVVVIASFNILPIMTVALVGCVLMVLSGCLSMREAYEAIEWKIIFLLAGTLALGMAMDKSGAAGLISGSIVSMVGSLGPYAVITVLYLTTTLVTEVMSNNACAVLIAPIAISAATALGLDPRPFLMTITFAASASFMTPVGYQTNTMVYGAGSYRFSDFTKIGAPLNLIFWILATLLIPVFFPFKPA